MSGLRTLSQTLFANVFANGLATIGILVLAYILSPSDMANIRVMQAYVIIGVCVGSLGFSTGVLKYCVENLGDKQELGLLDRVVRINFWSALAYVAVISLLALPGMMIPLGDLQYYYFAVVLLCTPLMVYSENIRNYMIAKAQFSLAANGLVVTRVLAFAIPVGCTYLWHFPGYVGATLVAAVGSAIWYFRSLDRRSIGNSHHALPDNFIRFSSYAMLGNLIVIFAAYGDMLMLNAMVSDRAQLGAYALASVMQSGLMLLTNSVQTILLPGMIRMHAAKQELRRYLIHKQLILAVASIAAALAACVVVFYGVLLIYGQQYQLVPKIFAGLCLSYVLVSCGTLSGSVLLGAGGTSINTAVAGASIVVGFLFAYFTIDAYGIFGMMLGKIVYGLVFCVLSNAFAFRALRD